MDFDALFSYLEENEISEIGILDPLDVTDQKMLQAHAISWIKESNPSNPRTIWFEGSITRRLDPMVKSRFVPMDGEKLRAWTQMGPFPAILIRREMGDLNSRQIGWLQKYAKYGEMVKAFRLDSWDLYIWIPKQPRRRALLICHHCAVLPDIRRQLLIHGIHGEFFWLSDGKRTTGDAWPSTFGPFQDVTLLLYGDYRTSISDDLAAEIRNRYSLIFTSHSIRYPLHFVRCGLPLFHINSTRFGNEWTYHPEGLTQLIEDCRSTIQSGQLRVIHNNLADKWYFEQYFGSELIFPHISSMCEQALRFRIRSPPLIAKPFLIWDTRFHAVDGGGSPLFRELVASKELRAICDITSELAEEKGDYLDDDMLANYRAVIHIPYNISTMSCFEQAAANIPVWIPSRSLLLECMGEKGYSEMSWYCFKSPEARTEALAPDRVWDSDILKEFIDRSDFERGIYKNLLVFSSIEDLITKINSVDYDRLINTSFVANCERKAANSDLYFHVLGLSA